MLVLAGERKGMQISRSALEVKEQRDGAAVRVFATNVAGFKSRRQCHTWVELVVGSLLCSEKFFYGYSGFPLSSKPTFPNSHSTRNQVDEEPLCGCDLEVKSRAVL